MPRRGKSTEPAAVRTEVLQGTPASPGIVMGEVYVMAHYETRILRRGIEHGEARTEIGRFEAAVGEEVAAVGRLGREAAERLGPYSKAIFEAQSSLLTDRALRARVIELVQKQHYTAEYAVDTALRHYIGKLQEVGDPYFLGRVPDLEDIGRRLLARLQGKSHSATFRSLRNPVILIARDLSPLVTATLDRSMILGFATDAGGRTSHAAIVARDLGIPAVVGLRRVSLAATGGTQVILDGYAGRVVINPDEATKNLYLRIQEQGRGFTSLLDSERHMPAETPDGVRVQVMGNIEFPEEVRAVVNAGGEGVGLYRTEFLYLRLGRHPPERAHLAAYRKALELLGRSGPLVIRTTDLGMDKLPLDDRSPARERNPFLGCRSIRLCQIHPEILKTQMRAILRVSAEREVRCMLPMITTRDEIRWAHGIIEETRRELARESLRFNPKMKVGIMIEVPSAALMADSLAVEADFFSIGTNDLVQYTLAVDRANEHVAGLFMPSHPSVLRLIQMTIAAAKKHKIEVSMCGEMAGEPLYVLLLLGMGLRKFSVAPGLIPEIKKLVRLVPAAEARRIAEKALSLSDPAEVTALLREETNRVLPGAVSLEPAPEEGAKAAGLAPLMPAPYPSSFRAPGAAGGRAPRASAGGRSRGSRPRSSPRGSSPAPDGSG